MSDVRGEKSRGMRGVSLTKQDGDLMTDLRSLAEQIINRLDREIAAQEEQPVDESREKWENGDQGSSKRT